MTNSDIETLKAAFLAKGGVIDSLPANRAYGADPAADKAERRTVGRLRREVNDGAWEAAHERHAEAVREAYHTGGRRAAIEAMNG